ncbi:MAG: glycosyltransferase family 9 protein [Desulfovibrionaceae bacterium]
MKEFHQIVFWQPAFLGDAVLALPALAALHQRFPGAGVHLVVRRGVEGLFAAQPGLTSVRGFDKRGAERSLGAALRLGRELGRGLPGGPADLFISAHTSLRSAAVAWASGIPERIGYDRPWHQRLAYTRTVSRRFDELHEVDRLMELLRPLGVTGPAPEPRLVPPEAATARASALLDPLPRPVLGIHPGSTWPTKRWPLEYFADVAGWAARAGATVLVFGGPSEAADAAAVVTGAGDPGKGRVLDLAGRLDLPTLAACLGRLDAYLTNDSGPMHLAWMQGTPTVALFGPTVRSLGFFPRGAQATVLELDLPCRPCGLHGHKRCPQGHHRCLREVLPEAARAALAPRLGL